MPRILFRRTPTEAEGGPGHPFRVDTVHDVGLRSARRWLEMEAAVLAPIDEPAALTHMVAEEKGVGKELPHVRQHEAAAETHAVATEGDAASGGALVAAAEPFETHDSGGEAPPIIVPAPHSRELRPAGRAGFWHVFEGEKQLSKQPMRKIDADALVECGLDADH